MKRSSNIHFSECSFGSHLTRAYIAVLIGLVFSTTSFGTIIFDNGNFTTGTVSQSGVPAPPGTQWSEVANDFGVTEVSNSFTGFNCGFRNTPFRCADDFNVPVGQTWTINEVIIFVYQPGYTGLQSPVISGTLRIWRGRPGDPGSTVVFGDETTNRLVSTVRRAIYRIGNTVAGFPSTPTTDNRIWQVNLGVSPAASLGAGHYWVDWQTRIGQNTFHFNPTETVLGTRATPFSNARMTGGIDWRDVIDEGVDSSGSVTEMHLKQEFPFKLEGSISGAPLAPRSRANDYNGDNKTDFAVVRASGPASQSTWWIRESSETTSGASWGLGVGHALGDRAAPADFDGDGKTDIAVWRPGGPGTAAFYILRSSDNAASVQPFGQTGDDPSVVGDFDGDGRADPAVYREGVAGGQSTFFYRGSFSNPAGNVTYVPWGIDNDVAIGGDYDGDGRMDFSVSRNQAGVSVHYRLMSTAGVSVLEYGLPTDRFFTGDFDADGRSDLAAVRANGASYDWYVRRSSDNVIYYDNFGNPATDYLVPGDYDGDNLTDLAVWRSGQGADQTNFFLRNTFTSPVQFEWGQSAGSGVAPDYPVANYVVK